MWKALCRIALLLIFAAAAADARPRDEIPPANARKLSEIVRTLESEGHTVIPEIRFGEQVWIARVLQRGFEFEIRIDPVSGEILSTRPK